jgi:hypothetical protein
MDGHDCRLLAGFLAGDLDPAKTRRWDEHLLSCERCWRAAREDLAGRRAAHLLRRPTPPGLADRVAFAVEVAAVGHQAAQRQAWPRTRSPRPTRSGVRAHSRWLAGGGALAVGVAVTLLLLMHPGGRETGGVPPAVAAVARYARAIPSPTRQQHARPGRPATAVELGRPVTVTADGQRIIMRTWQLGSAEVVVAVSDRPFPMPTHAQGASGGGMAWAGRLGRLSLYCVNGRTSELVAAPVPQAELAALAARLPPV